MPEALKKPNGSRSKKGLTGKARDRCLWHPDRIVGRKALTELARPTVRRG